MRKPLITLALAMALALPAFAVKWEPPEEGRSIYVLPPCGQDEDCVRDRIRHAERIYCNSFKPKDRPATCK
jgi:hypothetical protein